MIRQGRPEDFDAILKLCKEFWALTEFEDPFSPAHAAEMLDLSYRQGLLAVVDINGVQGFVCGIKAPLLGNGTITVGNELAWYVTPEHRGCGVELLEFIEGLAKEQGIKYWCMMALQSCMPDRVEAIYQKMGYHLTEKTYMRCLWAQ